MPKIFIDEAGAEITIPENYIENSFQVIGLYGNGANDVAKTQDEIALMLDTSPSSGTGGAKLTLPAQTYDSEGKATGPIQYLVKFDRYVSNGAKITNDTKSLPQINKLTLFCAMGDPCNDKLRPCYVVIPKFAPDPSMTLSLSADETTIDFSGNLNVD